jgi:hypothetical protein
VTESRRRLDFPHSPVVAAIGYSAITLVMTWPLAAGLASDVPADLGDPLLNMWILDWVAAGIVAVLSGSMSVADVWHANIFHPEPLALAFSEHLFGQSVQMLPAYAVSGNLILCYNLLFLATFALSGLGAFLFVRDLTGRVDAAFLAGIVFAFAPLRMAQLSHIQVLSTQWMPLALFGFRRFITTARWFPLAGGTAALLMNNWSCGYYLLFFTPFLPLFVVHQMYVHHRLRSAGMWMAFVAAAIVIAAGTLPFLTYYEEARRVHEIERSRAEVIRFSADLRGFLGAPEILRIWGPVLTAARKPEGEVFLGMTAMLLALVGVTTTLRTAWSQSARERRLAGWRRVLVRALVVLGLVQLGGLAVVMLTGGFVTSLLGLPIRATDAGRLLATVALVVAGLLALSARARASARLTVQATESWALAALLLAVVLSLGPMPTTGGARIEGIGLYGLLYDHIPGFEGLRVPARYAMMAALFLAMLAGAGAAALARRAHGPVIVGIAALACLAEGFAAPLPVNGTWADVAPIEPARVFPAYGAPRVYHTLARLPPGTVVSEFPFGPAAWELRYVFYATVHHQRLVNGYSGYFPRGYQQRVARIARIAEDPASAWRALVDAGTTHVVLHRTGLREGAGPIAEWLTSHGARLVQSFDDGDALFEMP